VSAVTVALIVLAAAVALVAFVALVVRAQARARRQEVQERWGLTDDEMERFVAELPEVLEGIEAALPPGTHSKREIADMAEQSTLRGVLLKRVPREEPELPPE
jgi:Flp pilus assembly protein TadB